ncbi:MAG: hypothetical protein ACOYON_14675 [Fimbriimonas sp.]
MSALCTTASVPQQVERTSVIPAPVSPVLRRFDNATGWILAGDEWVSADRRIGGGGTDGPRSLGLHEFRSLHWRTVELGGKKIPVFVITQTTGDYQYPAIREGWWIVQKATVLIFEKFPFIEPAKYEFGKTFSLEADSIRWTGYDILQINRPNPGQIEESEIREIVGKSAARPANKDYSYRFKMVVFPVEHEGQKKIRFLLECYNIKDRNGIGERTLRKAFPQDYLSVTPKALNSYYYETSFEAFRDFFTPLAD